VAKVKIEEAQRTEKTCFVISPIGKEGSAERRRSDDMFTHVLEPAAKASGYKAVRADKMSTPGIITNQIIHELLEAPLVIADLTDHNANVYYELAIRHVVRKPLVEVIKKGQVIPFDVSATRVLQLDEPDLNNVVALTDQMKTAIKAAENKSDGADNPITIAIDIYELGKSGKPLEARLAIIIEMLADIRAQMTTLQQSAPPSRLSALAGLSPTARGGMSVGLGETLAFDPVSFSELATTAFKLLSERQGKESEKGAAPDNPKT
jgi:hypothetical protein